jgi:hypothetical protein
MFRLQDLVSIYCMSMIMWEIRISKNSLHLRQRYFSIPILSEWFVSKKSKKLPWVWSCSSVRKQTYPQFKLWTLYNGLWCRDMIIDGMWGLAREVIVGGRVFLSVVCSYWEEPRTNSILISCSASTVEANTSLIKVKQSRYTPMVAQGVEEV